MKHRILGFLSFIIIGVISLFVYAGAATNTQPSGDSTSRSTQSHDHSHSHEEHGHSHEQTSQSAPKDTVVIPAPAGGPPPLPAKPPSPQSEEGPDLRSEPEAELGEYPIPAITSPRLKSDSGSSMDYYVCPNARQNQVGSQSAACSLASNFCHCSLTLQEQGSILTYSLESHIYSRDHSGRGAGSTYDPPQYFGRPSTTFRCGSNFYERRGCTSYHGY